jgi:hypothetical protein
LPFYSNGVELNCFSHPVCQDQHKIIAHWYRAHWTAELQPKRALNDGLPCNCQSADWAKLSTRIIAFATELGRKRSPGEMRRLSANERSDAVHLRALSLHPP